MKIRADLHIHSVLSPCGSLEMAPSAIVKQAKTVGLDLIAVADHNSIENSIYTVEAGKREGLHVIYGMEAQTIEEVHILCLFDQRPQIEKFYAKVYPFLPDMPNNPDFFGDQVVVNEEDDVLRFENKLLLNSLELSIGELLEHVYTEGGTAIPAHVESEKFGLMMNMGMIPEELRGSLFEISYNADPEHVIAMHPDLTGGKFITNSDAHYLKDIGRGCTVYTARSANLAGLTEASLTGQFYCTNLLQNKTAASKDI